MKKVIYHTMLVVLTILVIFFFAGCTKGSSAEESGKAEDKAKTTEIPIKEIFREENGVAVTIEPLDGTFRTGSGSSYEQLKYTVSITPDGQFIIKLLEKGEDTRLSYLQSPSDKYDVEIKFYNDEQSESLTHGTAYYGTNWWPQVKMVGSVIKGGSDYNTISFELFREYYVKLALKKAIKITISGNGVTYNLGEINIRQLNEWFMPFPQDLHPEGSCGGYVFYDKGYYSDGWRYLEAAPDDLYLVDGKPTVNPERVEKKGKIIGRVDDFIFGYAKDPNYDWDGTNACIYVNGTNKYDPSNCTKREIGTGAYNTDLLVKTMGNIAYKDWNYQENDYTWYYAAKLCSDLVYTAPDGTAYDDWFIPSIDELVALYSNLYIYGTTCGLSSTWYVSSTESDQDTRRMLGREMDITVLNSNSSGRGSIVRVRPIRAF